MLRRLTPFCPGTRLLSPAARYVALFLIIHSGRASATNQTVSQPLFDSDDYIVASFGTGTICVLDSDFSFKTFLAVDFPTVSDIEFDPLGNVVALGQNEEIRCYSPSGVLIPERSFKRPGMTTTVTFDIAADGNYWVGATDEGVLELTPSGVLETFIRVRSVHGVELLPSSRLWGTGLQRIRAYDLNNPSSPEIYGGIPALSMKYYESYDSVLVTDAFNEAVYEVNPFGGIRREFSAPGLINPQGITRGPHGDVIVFSSLNIVYRWSDTGALLETTTLIGPVNGPGGVLWAGEWPVPEPTSLSLAGLVVWAIVHSRRKPFPHS